MGEKVVKAERTAEGISLLRGMVIDEEKRCDAQSHPSLILTCSSSPIHDPVPAENSNPHDSTLDER